MIKTPLKMRRVLFDATSTIHTGYVTGIQRVVLSLEKQMRLLCQERAVVFDAVYFTGRDYQISKPGLRRRLRSKRRLLETLRRVRRGVFLGLKAVGGVVWVASRLLPKAVRPQLDPALLEQALKEGALSVQRALMSFARRVFGCLSLPAWLQLSRTWRPRRGDVLLLADATWNYAPWPVIETLRQSGVSVHTIVYDLLPLKYPSFFQPQLVASFERWWEKSVENSSSFMCISEAVKADVEARLGDKAQDCPAFVFPLGFDFSGKSGGAVEPSLLPSWPIDWARDLVFLAVGTLEPRKNHAYILDAMDVLWKKGATPKLVIVGRKGWMSDQLVARLESHPCFGTHLFWESDCPDARLEQLYAGADCLIAASFDEGYGLPIIEAAARGVPALVSDIPVFHEVSCASTRFFDLGDPASLAAEVEHTQKKQASSSDAVFPSWADAAKKVFLSLRHAARFALSA